MKPQWIFFLIAVPLCLYDTFYGVLSMGFCLGWGCLPIVWPLIAAAPCLLLAIWSLRATAIVMLALAVAFFLNDGLAFFDDQMKEPVLLLAALALVAAAVSDRRREPAPAV